jgi:hypothetical protein
MQYSSAIIAAVLQQSVFAGILTGFSGEKTSSTSDHSDGLRMMHVPHNLTAYFNQRAFSHTAVDKELCGIIAGKEVGDALVVTTLIIPVQVALVKQR